ncbi:proteasome subunit beta type-11-like [Hyperolius riggenbachi]|uniref:proteasome subunit beta type-11-like n=1 Tax=Hyperolius riggenbachi TaxID=752182 RepID=UPI0035A284BD
MALQSVCGWNVESSPPPGGSNIHLLPNSSLLRPPLLIKTLSSSNHPSTGPPPPAHGTTTLAFLYADGVAVATDTRASAGGLVCTPDHRKAFLIHSHLLATTSGSCADTHFFARVLARECRLYQVRNGNMPSVRGAARMLSFLMRPFRGTDVCAAFTLCGWDRNGPCICYVYNDGTRLSSEILSVGSGSPYAYSIIDEGYKPGMKEEEARQLARRAVCHAGRRDAYSGGLADVYFVKEGGCQMDPREDQVQLYERMREDNKGMLREKDN